MKIVPQRPAEQPSTLCRNDGNAPVMGSALFGRIGRFATETFPDATPVEHLLKLQHEAVEAQMEPNDRYEYADCLICLLAAAYKAGLSYDDLLGVADEKLTICLSRNWVRKDDGTYQHCP